jgi:hypothetical protein
LRGADAPQSVLALDAPAAVDDALDELVAVSQTRLLPSA